MENSVERIRVAGFRSLESADLTLDRLNVLIGANGAGKSSFLALFSLLNALTDERLQLWVAEHGGAGDLFFYGPKRTPKLEITLTFTSKDGENLYHAEFIPVAGDRLAFAAERLEFRRAGLPKPFVVDLGGGHSETRLAETLRGSNPKAAKTAQVVKYRLDRWRSYHFHDTSPHARVKQKCDLDNNRFLEGDAGNLAAFLRVLREQHRESYVEIREALRLAFPLFGDFVLEPTAENERRLLLTWKERTSSMEFGPHLLSDGTLRLACLAALLLQPFERRNAPYTITVDEPELGLHPAAIGLLGELLVSASRKVQIIVATQSPTLLGAIGQPEAVVAVEREPSVGATTLRRLETSHLEHWLETYSLGDIWEKGVVGARP